MGTLGRIVAEAEGRAAVLELSRDALTVRVDRTPPGPSLDFAIGAAADVSILAEVKRRSPSKGIIAAALGAVDQAAACTSGPRRLS